MPTPKPTTKKPTTKPNAAKAENKAAVETPKTQETATIPTDIKKDEPTTLPLTRPPVPTEAPSGAGRPAGTKNKPKTLNDMVRITLTRVFKDEIEAMTTRLLAGTYKAGDFIPDLTGKLLKIPENAKIEKEDDLKILPAAPPKTRGPKMKVLPKEAVQKVYDLRKGGATKPSIQKDLGFKSRKTVDKAISLFESMLGADFKNDPAPASVLEEERKIATRFQKNMQQKGLKALAAQLGISEAEIMKRLDAQYAATDTAKVQGQNQ